MDAFRALQAEFDHEERSLLSSRGEEPTDCGLNHNVMLVGAVLALGAAVQPGLVGHAGLDASTGR